MTTEQASSIGSFRTVLKSTSLIGGASVLNILISMVRTKFAAILLGPAGVGLLGMYIQITALVSTGTGMGIGSSGVRQVAEAVGTNNDERIARTVITLRRAAWLTGGLGMLFMIVLCVPISRVTFTSSDYSWEIALLGVTLLLASITAGQACVLRGTRRIADIARITVGGALGGTLISIPCFYFWGEQGIVVSLIFSGAATLVVSWWYARRVPIAPLVMSWRESWQEARTLLALGISFMGAGLVSSATAYAILTLLIRQFGIAEVGIYQAAYSLSGVLVGFVLGAMGADYYPRLTAVAGDNASVYRMVNEQSQIAILLALPGLAAMMVFAPLVIQLFYASSFAPAVPILRWCILGILGRVFSWPAGFVLLAKGKGKLFFITEVFSCALHLGCVFAFIRLWGLKGAGIAFMVLYVVHTALMLLVMRRLVGATWTRHTLDMTLIASTVMVLLMLNCTLNSYQIVAWPINLSILAAVTFLCLRQLAKKSNIGLQALLYRVGMK
jgi:PST family polysaccharide transporter